MKKISLILLLVVIAFTANAGFITGKYLGNGGTTKSITGLGFRPEVVLVKSNGWQNGWIATATMTGGYAKDLTSSAAPTTGYISSLDADGFTVANSQHSNAAGTTYYYVVWDDADGSINVGSITPNECASLWAAGTWYGQGSVVKYGANNYKAIDGYYSDAASRPDLSTTKWQNIGACGTFSTTINTGYRPEMVWILGEGANWDQTAAAQFVFDGPNANKPAHFNSGSYLASEEKIIADLNSNGFSVKPVVQPGTHNGTSNGTKYNYVVFKPSQKVITNTYTGTAVNNLSINALKGAFVIAKNVNNTENTWWKTEVMGTDSSFKFTGGVSNQNIKNLTANGFTLGYGGETNGNGGTYEYFIMGKSCSAINVNITPSSATILQGGSVQLIASGASSYEWSPATALNHVAGPEVTANPTATTTYTVIGTDANGCSGSASVTVIVNSIVHTQTNTNVTAQIIGSCPGDSTGSITLNGLDTMYTGQLNIANCSEGVLVSDANITVNTGETKRIASSITDANITINGGKLIVCGTVSIASLNLLGNGILINNGTITVNQPITIPDGAGFLNNVGNATFNSTVTVEGLLFNLNGSITANSTLTTALDGQIFNNSTINDAIHNSQLPVNFDETEARKYSTVSWTGTSQTGAAINRLKPGEYTATIYIAGAKTTRSFTVPVINAPQIDSVFINDNTSNENCTGNIFATASGGVAPYFFFWSQGEEVIARSSSISGLCTSDYTLQIIDSRGCQSDSRIVTVSNNIEIPTDTTDSINSGDGDSIPEYNELIPTSPIDTVAAILKSSGLNAIWNLSTIDFNKYLPITMEDSAMYTQILPSTILRNYSTAYGDSVFISVPLTSYEVNSFKIDRIADYSVKADATGKIVIGNITYDNLKRICVREKYSYICAEGCDAEGMKDTVSIIIDNYYWFSSDTSQVPILTYREITKIFAFGSKAFYQEILQQTENSNLSLESFRALVNLHVSPNPATSSSVAISYFLPQDASITLSISNSLTGFYSLIQSTNQSSGNYSTSNSIDNYPAGIYTIQLSIDGVPINTNLVVNH